MSEERWAVYPSLKDRLVVVTGGASGIGEAIVEAFLRQGSRVVFLDVMDEAAEALERRTEASGVSVPVYARCDLTEVDGLRGVMADVLERFGRVDVLVNNAANDTRHRLEEVSEEFWDRTLAVNLRAQFFMAQAVLPGMRRAGAGSVINMGSISWVIPSRGVPVYATAKAAIVGMTRLWRTRLGRTVCG